MATNPYNNKVELSDGTVLMDLTGDTVTPQTMVRGTTAHDRSGASITGVVDLANAGSNTPLPDAGAGAVGIATAYSREDHVHPIRTITYSESTGSFLDWILTTFTNTNDEARVIINTTNTTGLPQYSGSYAGFAMVYKNGSMITILYFQSWNGIISNMYNGTSWTGWAECWNNSPTYTYTQESGSFLDYVISTIVPTTKASHQNALSAMTFIPFETTNYTGWPKDRNGYAECYIRGNTVYLTAHCTDGSCHENYNDGTGWIGWKESAMTSSIPSAGTSVPLAESASGSVGTSTAYSRQDHSHPVKTYLYWNIQTDFLPWVVSNFTVNGSYYVVLANDNATGLPEDPCNACANVYVRNANIMVELITNTRHVYVNVYGVGWTGWNRLAAVADLPAAATSAPDYPSRDGAAGSSTAYARADHSHPGAWYRYMDSTLHFLPWVLSTFSSNGFYYVVIANGDYTDLPEQAEGIALIEYRGGFRFVELTCNATGNVYRNEYNGGWTGWKRFLFESDFTSSSSYLKMPDGTLMQWGYVNSISFSNVAYVQSSIIFPEEFIDTNYSVTANSEGSSNLAYTFRIGIDNTSKSQCLWTMVSGSNASITVSNRGFHWIAIGRWKS